MTHSRCTGRSCWVNERNVQPSYPSSLFFGVSEKRDIHWIPYWVSQSCLHSTNTRGCLCWELGTRSLSSPARTGGRGRTQEQTRLEVRRGQGVWRRPSTGSRGREEAGLPGEVTQGQSHGDVKRLGALETPCVVWEAGAGRNGWRERPGFPVRTEKL